jgi:phosphate transport system substrate-binding protein
MTKPFHSASALFAALLLAACGGSAPEAAPRTNILVAGSSTVYPFTKAVAERFHAANARLPAPDVQSTGTGAGLEAFCAGNGGASPDIVGASRRISRAELQRCRANGITNVTELQIGIDGVVIVNSPAGPPVALSRREIYEAIAATPYGQPNRRTRWNQVNPSLPDIPILVYGPPERDGTRDSLVETILVPGCETNAEMRRLKESDARRHNQICTTIRNDGVYVASGEDDEHTATMLIVNPGGLGIFGYSYLEQRGERLRGIAIDGVAPSAATIAAGTYPASRPLYLYVKSALVPQMQGLRGFLDSYLQAVAPGGYLAQAGFVPAPEEVRTRTAEAARTLPPLNVSALLH